MFATQSIQTQQQQQAIQQQQLSTSQQFADTVVALTRPAIYGDERDKILATLNRLLAMSGCGKAYHHGGAPPIEFTPEGPFCRFKAVGYNRLTGYKNEDGLVAFIVKKSANDVANVKQQFIDGIFKIMGSKPNLALKIENIKPLPSDKGSIERCEVLAYVNETSPVNMVTRRIPALDCYNFFAQQGNKIQLEQLLQVAELAPKVDPLLEKVEEYLATPIQGIDRTVWMQAQRDNPDPANLLPWPILGFRQLRERRIMQQQEFSRQSSDITELLQKIGKIERNTLMSNSRLTQLKASEDQLSHRVFKIIATIYRLSREGHAIDANEELLRSRLESVFISLNGPLQIKGRLSELLSQVRSRNYGMLEQSTFTQTSEDAAASASFVDEAKMQLKKLQDGLERMVDTTLNNVQDLDIMDESLKNSYRSTPKK